MVESYIPLHSYSVISEDKPSHIPNSLNSSFIKRSPPFQSMISDSSTEDDDPSQIIAHPSPIPPLHSQPIPVKPKSDFETNPESNPVETPVNQETLVETKPEPNSPQIDDESVTQEAVPTEPSPEPEPEPDQETEPEPNAPVTELAPDPLTEKDPINPQVTEESIIEDVKSTVVDEITTRISLSTPSPSHPPVPVPIPISHQIGSTLKDEISTTVQSNDSSDDNSSTTTVIIIIILLLVIIAIAIIIFFVCKRYRKKKGAGKGGKGKKMKQTNVKVTKKKSNEANNKESAKTAKSISEMKKNGKGLKGKNVDISKTRSSSSKSTKSGRNQIPAPPLEVDSTLESDPTSSPAKIEAEQSVFVCYGNKWRQVRRVDSDFSFSIASQ